MAQWLSWFCLLYTSELHVDEEKMAMPEFKALWSRINYKTVYVVDFDTDELVRNAISSLDKKLRVSKIYFKVVTGAMDQIKSKEELIKGASFVKEEADNYNNTVTASSNVKYDLIGKLVDETKLTRKDIIRILQGIQPSIFNQFKDNPEEFINKSALSLIHILQKNYGLLLSAGKNRPTCFLASSISSSSNAVQWFHFLGLCSL